MRVYTSTTEGFEWLRERTCYQYGPAFEAAEARDARGRIVGVVGIDMWMGKCAQLHLALEDPMAIMGLAGAIIDYGFNRRGLRSMLAFISIETKNTLRLLKRIGFREAGRVKGGSNGGFDLLMLELRPENCLARWKPRERRAA